MIEETILLVTELIGTIAFSISGSLIAIKSRLDLFGVLMVGCITTFGGGIIRDLLLGHIPPAVFSNLEMLALAGLTSILVFFISYLNSKKFSAFERKIEMINNVFDAVGLAAFSVIGTEAAFAAGFGDRGFFSVCMGMLTGIGGGIMRDVLVDKTPYVFQKHIYALASITGSLLYYLIHLFADKAIAAFIAIPVVVLIRIIATRFRLQLPRVKIDGKNFDGEMNE